LKYFRELHGVGTGLVGKVAGALKGAMANQVSRRVQRRNSVKNRNHKSDPGHAIVLVVSKQSASDTPDAAESR
jgi:hypothetical protein